MLLSFPELCAFLKADEPMVMSLIEAGSVPPPVNIGNQLIRWVEGDLVRWVQMGCPNFPPPTPEELDLIRTNRVEQKTDTEAETNEKSATKQHTQSPSESP
jgi:predicted DNA-binding transcriptional regulator AlpA